METISQGTTGRFRGDWPRAWIDSQLDMVAFSMRVPTTTWIALIQPITLRHAESCPTTGRNKVANCTRSTQELRAGTCSHSPAEVRLERMDSEGGCGSRVHLAKGEGNALTRPVHKVAVCEI